MIGVFHVKRIGWLIKVVLGMEIVLAWLFGFAVGLGLDALIAKWLLLR